jgi:hypothetical protein
VTIEHASSRNRATFRDTRPPAWLLRIANPVVKYVLRSPMHRPLSRSLMVLELTGRRSGRRMSLPVGRHQRSDGTFLLSAGGKWRLNLRGGAHVHVVLDGQRLPARAQLEEDPRRSAELFLELLDLAGERPLALKFSPRRPRSLDELELVLPDLFQDRGVATLSLHS